MEGVNVFMFRCDEIALGFIALGTERCYSCLCIEMIDVHSTVTKRYLAVGSSLEAWDPVCPCMSNRTPSLQLKY